MNSITDVPGVLIGQAQDDKALTGVTVILTPEGAVGGVDVRGSAPGTRETDLLDPSNLVQKVQAVAFCGGSAFGLEAVGGVMDFLKEKGLGFPTLNGVVPIVPAAVIYDLALGYADQNPKAAMGFQACKLASREVKEGNFGAGTGASIGKIFGLNSAMKGGVGTSSARLNYFDPLQNCKLTFTVGVIVVTNAFGDIYRQDSIIAGACKYPNGEFLDTVGLLRKGIPPSILPDQFSLISNTTLACVATDAPLTKAMARKLAQMAQDGLGRAIRPAHTLFDGDTVFALSTGGLPTPATFDPFLLTGLGSLAAELVVEAIHRSVLKAESSGGLPSAGRFP